MNKYLFIENLEKFNKKIKDNHIYKFMIFLDSIKDNNNKEMIESMKKSAKTWF